MTDKKYFVQRKDLLYPELSFKINGALFRTYREIGGGHQEKVYEKALAIILKDVGLTFEEQVYVPLQINNKFIGKYYLDFLIEGSIVLELKRGKFTPAFAIDQVKKYLSILNLQLAIIGCFTYNGVVTKRIVNITNH